MKFEIEYETLKVANQTVNSRKTAYEPKVFFEGEPWKLYFLFMYDPDAPAKSWVHWMISNIPGNVPDIHQGDFVLGYAPPNPPSGTHRYIFVLYEQPGSLMIPKPNQRGHFDVEDFENRYALKRVAEKQIRVHR
jgi:phosphatidylethanolamine-binding protein (PEBP) family uncharacterized protein